MAIGNHVFAGELHQRAGIDGLRHRLARSSAAGRSRISQTAACIGKLENKLAETARLLRAPYVYLKDQPGFDGQHFAAIIDQVDADDGTRDGKARKRKKP